MVCIIDDKLCVIESIELERQDFNYCLNKVSDVMFKHNLSADTFDFFLDFLAKLDYLRKINLLTEEEVDYFRYFIDRAAKSEGIVNYIKIYNFQLHGNLNKMLK